MTTELTLQQLVDRYATVEQMTADLAAELRALEYELLKRMEAEGATEAVGSTDVDARSYTPKAIIKRSVSYSSETLHVLLELLPEEELRDKGAYIPAHTVTTDVAEAWNATKLKPFAKLGTKIADVIEQAKIYGTPRIKIERTP